MYQGARKHDAMYSEYGYSSEHKCKECINFVFIEPGARRHSKCLAYGITNSEASDWNGRKTACGLFNQKFDDKKQKPLIDIIKFQKRNTSNLQCDGQMKLFDEDCGEI